MLFIRREFKADCVALKAIYLEPNSDFVCGGVA